MKTKSEERKLTFIEDLNENIVKKYFHNIESINYEIYKTKDKVAYEFLVVNYVGGAKAVRNCTANSLSATLREFTKLVDGGYYEELDFYQHVKSKFDLEA